MVDVKRARFAIWRYRAFRGLVATLIAVPILVSCSTISPFHTHTEFTQTMSYPRSARAPGEIMLVFQRDVPARPIARVGIVRANRSDIFVTDRHILDGLREEAARNGLDGVADIFCDAGYCTGKGFVFIDNAGR